MAKSRIRISKSFRDLGSVEPGYDATGESRYTRNAAQGPKRDFKLSPTFNHRKRFNRPMTFAEKIADHKNQIKWLTAEIQIESNAARRAKLEQQVEIKTRLLSELREGGSHAAG